MRSIRIALCLVVLGLAVLPPGSYALTVGSPYKTGSLLVFPFVNVTESVDTVIAITNSHYLEVNVLCQHRSVSDEVSGAVFPVGGRDTVWFSLGTGGGSMPSPLSVGEEGEIKCWAVDASGTKQISWNYLQGLAEITDDEGDIWLHYSSWNFAANKPRGESVGKPGVIKLSGLSGKYDAMPKSLRFNVPGTVTEARLTLVLGKQDVTQDRRNVYSKARFAYDRWGTSSTQCIMDQVQSMTIDSSRLGGFKVQGIASTVCDVKFGLPPRTTQNSPLLGVLQARTSSSPFTAIMPSGVGADGSGYILWDPDPGNDK